jgi:nitrite reductase (NO-forming)
MAGALTIAAGGVAGYAIARMDDDDPGVTAQEGTGASGGLAPGPEPGDAVSAPRDARLPALQPSPLELTWAAKPQTIEIAGGVQYQSWTFEGLAPGPVLHVKQGDRVNFTLVNEAEEGHSMDFHSARTPPNVSYATIVPGDSINFEWEAEYPGVFMYHCGTASVLHHIGNGMYGAVVVDPATPLAAAREYVLVQSEFYASAGEGDEWVADLDKMKAPRPDIVCFNGAAFQYRDFPLQAEPGELVRLYVVNAGPTLFSAFHVIGAIFDSVYVDGNPNNRLQGVSTYTVAPGQGCTFEMRMPEAGQYPFVSHSFAYTELGAVGLINIT